MMKHSGDSPDSVVPDAMARKKKKTAEPDPTPSPVRVLAAIDIGTNSIRLAVGQILEDGSLQILERLHRPVRLGQDTFRRGRLRAKTMSEAVSILREFRAAMEPYQVDRFRGVATSAVREASNGDTFLDRAWMATGLEISVISVAEESRLTVGAVSRVAEKLLASRKNALVVQVGGGNTVLNLLTQGRISTTQSLPIGAIRQQEILSVRSEPAAQAARLIRHHVSGALSTFSHLLPLKKIQTFVAMGADMRWAASRVVKKKDAEGLWRIPEKAFADLIADCQDLSADKLARKHGLSFLDAETLNPAMMIHRALLDATRAKIIIVPGVSMLDGLLGDLASGVSGNLDESVIQQTIESSLAILAKYGIEEKHALRVSELAVRLYDLFEKEHRLDRRHRLLLRVAAILHEIGTFVSSRAYHKHTLYLISNSEVFGLTQEELPIVANVARYHRRSRPKPSHPAYMQLDREKRMVVNKLAALLRVADSLDFGRTQQIDSDGLRVEGETLWVTVPRGADLTLEQRTLRGMSDVFRDIYGLEIRLESGESK